jgi:hypothetical protein
MREIYMGRDALSGRVQVEDGLPGEWLRENGTVHVRWKQLSQLSREGVEQVFKMLREGCSRGRGRRGREEHDLVSGAAVEMVRFGDASQCVFYKISAGYSDETGGQMSVMRVVEKDTE